MTIRTILTVLITGATLAYSQSPEGPPSFDVASLRPASPGRSDRIRVGGPGTASPGRFSDSSASLANLLRLAYGLTKAQVVGPSWIETSQYAIAVTMPPDTTPEQFHRMLQNLLMDRFALRLHHKTQDVAVLTLEPAPGGIRVKKWLLTDTRPDPIVHRGIGTSIPEGLTPDDKGFPIIPAPYTFGYLRTDTPLWNVRAACRGCTMHEFVENLEKPFLARMWFSGSIADSDPAPLLVDKTGIAGKLNFNLEFEQLKAVTIIRDPTSGYPFAAAMERQLGIRLVKGKKAPMDVLVVDRAAKTPTSD